MFGSEYRTSPGHVVAAALGADAARGRPGRGRDRAGELPRRPRPADPASVGVLADPRRRCGDRDRPRARRAARRDGHARRAPRRSARRRLARRGPRGSRDAQARRRRTRSRTRPLRCSSWLAASRCASPLRSTSVSPAPVQRHTPPRLSWRRVRTLVISDLHLGSRLEHDVLTRPEPLRRLLRALDDVDRLVLLGDTVELLEGRPQHAMHDCRAGAWRDRATARAANAKCVIVPGNHDRATHIRLAHEQRRRAGVADRVPLGATPALARMASSAGARPVSAPTTRACG